jgi:hypothetical protein
MQNHKPQGEKKIIVELYLKRFKVNLLEAANLTEDLV